MSIFKPTRKSLKELKFFILAAGLGTRLYPLTRLTPKPLLNITDKMTILDYVLDYIGLERGQELDATQVFINVHSHPMMMLEHLGGYPFRISGETELQGTAGALKKVEEHLSDPFIVLNGDTLVGNLDLEEMLEVHYEQKADATVFTKHKSSTHTGGVYIFNRSVLDLVPNSTPWDIGTLIKDLEDLGGPVVLYNPADSWYIDCGTFGGLEKARKLYGESTKNIH